MTRASCDIWCMMTYTEMETLSEAIFALRLVTIQLAAVSGDQHLSKVMF